MNDYDWYCFCFITGTISSAQQLNLNSFNSSWSNSLKPAAVNPRWSGNGSETQRHKGKRKERGERGGKNRGEGPDCSYSLTPRCSCHFKKWSNIINGGLAGPDILLRLTSPRPSHHYHGPSSIKIQSLLRLVWLRRASVQIRGADPLLSVLRGGGGGWGCPQRLLHPDWAWSELKLCGSCLISVVLWTKSRENRRQPQSMVGYTRKYSEKYLVHSKQLMQRWCRNNCAKIMTEFCGYCQPDFFLLIFLKYDFNETEIFF